MTRLLPALALIACTTAWAESELDVVTPQKTKRVSLSELKAKLQTHLVEIDDPVYHAKKSYDGFLLTEVLALAGLTADEGADEIVFRAKDGYEPNTGYDALKKHVAYLVFQEHGKPGHFDLVAQGKSQVSPAPFYVVWAEGAKIEYEVAWPYQLVRIEAVRFQQKYPALFPRDLASETPERKGFLTFKNQCLRCHSINLQGGELGPELNIPKNVTEYWRADVLRDFIKDASSFRMKSKMPSFTFLKPQEVDNLIAYLRYMARHKISQ